MLNLLLYELFLSISFQRGGSSEEYPFHGGLRFIYSLFYIRSFLKGGIYGDGLFVSRQFQTLKQVYHQEKLLERFHDSKLINFLINIYG